MKTFSYVQTFNFPEAKKLHIENNMAPIFISPSSSEELIIQVELKAKVSDDFVMEDYLEVSYNDGTISVELEEIDDITDNPFARGQVEMKIMVPKLESISLEADNHAFNLNGLDSDIEIGMENGMCSLSNCNGRLSLESENGPIRLHNHTGDIKISMENGPLSAEGLCGETLSVESENGAIKLRSSAYRKVDIRNENGMIYFETLPVDSAEIDIESENGMVNLVIPTVWSFEIYAQSELGVLKNKLDIPALKVDEGYIISSGEKESKIRIKTENGVIKVSNDRHLNLDFLRTKLDQLKEAVASVKNLEDKEQVQKLIDNIIAYLNKGLNAIPEEKIKENITNALNKMKQQIDGFDIEEAKDKAIQAIDNLSKEIQTAFQDILHTFKDKVETEKMKDFKEKVFMHGSHFHNGIIDPELGNKINEKVYKTIRKVMPHVFDLKDREKEEIAEQSRLKILQMLESGKITAEDAERLLKAISKD